MLWECAVVSTSTDESATQEPCINQGRYIISAE